MMIFFYLNCSNFNSCFIMASRTIFNYEFNFYSAIIPISFIGFLLNSICVAIFCSWKNLKSNFFQFLKYYSINSMLIHLNDLIMCASFSINQYNYIYESNIYVTSYAYTIYYSHIYLVVWSVCYSFSGILDMFIIYERLQLYNSKFKFLLNTSACKISLFVLLISIFINIPINISRQSTQKMFSINSSNLMLYKYDSTRFTDNKIFLIFVFMNNFIRDVLTLFVEVFLNGALFFSIKSFFKRKITLTAKNSNQTNLNLNLRLIERRNSEISVFLSILSSLTHLLTFSVFVSSKLDNQNNTIMSSGMLPALFNALKNSINFFIFLLLNKQFRQHLLKLIAKINVNNSKIKTLQIEADPRKIQIVPINTFKENINMETICTKL